MKQLTAKNGEKEWQYEGKTLIAVQAEGTECKECYFHPACITTEPKGMPNCVLDFNDYFINYIEKPAK